MNVFTVTRSSPRAPGSVRPAVNALCVYSWMTLTVDVGIPPTSATTDTFPTHAGPAETRRQGKQHEESHPYKAAPALHAPLPAGTHRGRSLLLGEVPPLPQDRPAQALVHARTDLLRDRDGESTPAGQETFMRPVDPSKTYQGNPCRRGHTGTRYIKGGACIECCKLTDTARRKSDPQPSSAPVGKPA